MKCRNKNCENEALTDASGTWRQCAECMNANARRDEENFRRVRWTRKEAKKVRGKLAYLRQLAGAESFRSSRASEALADESRIVRAEARVAEAEFMLKQARREVRENIGRNWTKAEIEAAVQKVAEERINARVAANVAAGEAAGQAKR